MRNFINKVFLALARFLGREKPEAKKPDLITPEEKREQPTTIMTEKKGLAASRVVEIPDDETDPGEKIERPVESKAGVTPGKQIFPRKRLPLTLNIGVDYGTSTTKVAVREVGTDTCYPIPLSKTETKDSKFDFPSTIVLRDGSLKFGLGDQVFLQGDEIIRSLKVCLSCDPEDRNCDQETSIDPRMDCDLKILSLNDRELGVEEGSALYLADVLRRTHQILERNFPEDKFEKKFAYVFSAPVAGMEQVSVIKSFERVAAASIRMKESLREDLNFLDLKEKAGRFLLRDIPKVKNFQVRPESIAAVVPLLVHGARSLNEGMHAIVDVGAGTTDAAYFWLTRESDNPRVEIYSVSNRVLGGDNLDRELLSLLEGVSETDPDKRARWLQEIRVRKRELNPYIHLTGASGSDRENAGVSLSINGESAFLSLKGAHQTMLEHAHLIREVLTDACRKGWPLVRAIDRWTNQKAFFIGGGTQLKYVQEVLKWGPTNITHVSINFEQIELPLRGFTRLPKERGEFPDELHHLFQVAKGLSYHPRSLPKITLPSDKGPTIISLDDN